ncbi:MAG: hypothetical protein RML12_01475 [Xanthomonadales bacterium]|nr:hypothetical protein [Xanthomonadales bacterium]
MREESRTTLAGLAAQRAELEASLNRQELALREQQERLARIEAESAGDGGRRGGARAGARVGALRARGLPAPGAALPP